MSKDVPWDELADDDSLEFLKAMSIEFADGTVMVVPAVARMADTPKEAKLQPSAFRSPVNNHQSAINQRRAASPPRAIHRRSSYLTVENHRTTILEVTVESMTCLAERTTLTWKDNAATTARLVIQICSRVNLRETFICHLPQKMVRSTALDTLATALTLAPIQDATFPQGR
ncbi:hypothetical protein BGZ95_005008 [Linnemannia exigua]|uniref:Uncharacterized protein n=1 Tax=Linnemannia exigua TaxID=604196 RepID=A0AAD4D2S3_9FUNG|nr:hypothetical protein BGZ95_005008 [Linnemannia exigua]